MSGIDATVLLYAALTIVFAGAAIAVLFLAREEAKMFSVVVAAFGLVTMFAATSRANDLFHAAHPPPPPEREHTVTVRCPPLPAPEEPAP